jgi:hypothetical protein
MLIKLDFNVSAWIKELVIEADSDLDALNKLNAMTLAEIVEAASIIDSTVDISDARTEVLEQDLTVKVTNIEYDFTGRNMDPAVIDYLKARLPQERTLTLRGVSAKDDLEESIKDEIEFITDYEVKSLEYQIIEEK